MKIDISIIIPVYNAEEYIERTINSVVSQNMNEIEIIIINDGSNDNTLSIINSIAKTDKRIKVFTQKNGGVSLARNTGIENANGDYICFLDADDVLLENGLQSLLKNARQNDADISIGDTKVVKIDGRIFLDKETEKVETFSKKEILKMFLKDTSSFDSYSACAKLYSKKIYSKLRFEEGRNSNEDRYYFFQAICISNVIVYQNKNVYCYEKHSKSLSNSKVDRRILDNLHFADEIAKYINQYEKWACDLAIYNKLVTYMMVYRNFYRDKDSLKMYKNDLDSIRNSIIKTKGINELGVLKKIEIFVIKHFNEFYYIIVKLFDKIKNMVM